MDDLISRRGAIEALTENKEMINAVLDSLTLDYNTRRNQEQRRGQINEDVETIKALPSAQQEPRWIPCSERLPNSQTEVIVSCRDDSTDTIYRYTASGWITTNGEYWIVDNEINPYVVAWMSLPKPWKGEQHG